MSYNRGMRRDSGRRSEFGGGGGNRRGGGNYMSSYDNYNSNMNPWEGGMVPGRSGSSMLGSQGQGDLLSQLTSPEAQLALASNLITKLISQQQSVPSLLNMGNMGSGGGMSSFNDSYGNNRNFQDRRRRMDQRRTEPYNKSGMNRRMDSDRRNLGRNRTGYERKTPVSKSPKAQKEENKKDKEAEKPNGDVKTEPTDVSKREEKKEEETESSHPKEAEKETKPIPIPAALLYCHVCSKNMWDEISFTKHLKGRPHQLMMDGLNEKYKLKVDLLRHEMRLAEQQREMELERKQRQGLKIYNHPREYCAMCDLHFYGNLISHRKNVRHQKLKAFLHPKCSHCNKEFSTRLEWDEHRLQFSHLEKVAEFRRATKPNMKDDDFDIDELVNPDSVNCGEMVNKEIPVLVRSHSEEDITGELKEEPLKEREDAKKDGKEGEEKKEEEKENEMAQGIDIEPSKLPKYIPSVPVGKDLVIQVTGYMCRVCSRFIQSEEECKVHCRTLSHYNNYCNTVRAKARIMGRKKRNDDSSLLSPTKDGDKEDEKVAVKTEGDEAVDGDNDNAAEDDEGNWKRRKVSDKDESMEVDESKTEEKDDIPDSVWEEVDKDIDESIEATKETEEAKEEDSAPVKRGRGGGGRGGRRGRGRGK
ncbi:zinc finger protein on ecdysone puffs-like [Macrosteles quadrilineatus]|uniref:zinc finger protein on ecdysone puffs-like n=1 Tax=Macrosteles quadrilineatus TaxID=74068 RepID=UPI0023E23A2F|nr:zinc finger protein on ecdysone puffs-like [Macrosteles quadrilineatus]